MYVLFPSKLGKQFAAAIRVIFETWISLATFFLSFSRVCCNMSKLMHFFDSSVLKVSLCFSSWAILPNEWAGRPAFQPSSPKKAIANSQHFSLESQSQLGLLPQILGSKIWVLKRSSCVRLHSSSYLEFQCIIPLLHSGDRSFQARSDFFSDTYQNGLFFLAGNLQ